MLSKIEPAGTDIETKYWDEGVEWVAGTDEVGRGPIAGPVVAAAVVLPRNHPPIVGVLDSKRLSKGTLLAAVERIKEVAVSWSVARCSNQEIDRSNILKCSLEAMRRSIESLKVRPGIVLVDGNQTVPGLGCDQETVIKGDSRSASIAAASILAKHDRDQLMIRHHETYPEYGWDGNKGYPSKNHLEALQLHGVTPLHRLSFRPCALVATKKGDKKM